ncbi:hypothetical protein [Persicitalea jodogahamensis]|uniref:Lipoprotein n=1 Tax=Persicitalea jodogahamensis TaxID=402147 RepID=A0A8J3DA36_9BACT|nr:hypothetical protein [Persicitalea jodogahamensis]GHB81082.1 hypothetical protein GCM10007390_39720 [Persicitalea jodogahamensis]
MKKLLKTITPLAITLVLGCSKDGTSPSPQNCVDNSQKVTDAVTVYATNPNKANCEAYKNTVRDFFKSCPTYFTGASKQAYEDFLAEPCPN